MLELVPIDREGHVGGVTELSDQVREMCAATARWYRTSGYVEPWTGYLAARNGAWVGGCGFKSAPVNGRVEIAYGVFPGEEGQGIATEMARRLIDLARRTDANLLVTAQTLPVDGASPAILRKLGFTQVRTVEHPEDGTVWEWELGG